ncbi:hypothetical protein C8J57DRAFT_1602011 [Mycena rebaudengoi]|nr:hypothetical protein C8J57DRAFT_1602011 [Mycena rebaudengoi]
MGYGLTSTWIGIHRQARCTSGYSAVADANFACMSGKHYGITGAVTFLEDVFAILDPESSRCRSIVVNSKHVQASDYILDLDGGLSEKPTSAHDLFPFRGILPVLTSLRLDVSLLLWGGIPMCLKLRILVLHHIRFSFEPSLGEFLALFKSTPHLECLQLRYISCKEVDVQPSPSVITLPCLTHLVLSPVEESTFLLVAAIKMPALRNIILDIYEESLVSHVIDYLHEALHSVTMARWDLVQTSTDEIPKLFDAMPALEVVDGRGAEPCFSELIHEMAVGSLERWPKLSALVLGEVPEDKMLLDIMRASTACNVELHAFFPRTINAESMAYLQKRALACPQDEENSSRCSTDQAEYASLQSFASTLQHFLLPKRYTSPAPLPPVLVCPDVHNYYPPPSPTAPNRVLLEQTADDVERIVFAAGDPLRTTTSVLPAAFQLLLPNADAPGRHFTTFNLADGYHPARGGNRVAALHVLVGTIRFREKLHFAIVAAPLYSILVGVTLLCGGDLDLSLDVESIQKFGEGVVKVELYAIQEHLYRFTFVEKMGLATPLHNRAAFVFSFMESPDDRTLAYRFGGRALPLAPYSRDHSDHFWLIDAQSSVGPLLSGPGGITRYTHSVNSDVLPVYEIHMTAENYTSPRTHIPQPLAEPSTWSFQSLNPRSKSSSPLTATQSQTFFESEHCCETQ